MRDETIQQLQKLARSLRLTRDHPSGGAVLLLGGEASMCEGRPVLETLRRLVLRDDDPQMSEELLDQQSASEQILKFDAIWSGLSPNARSGYWRELKSIQTTEGLAGLAEILAEHYFPIVLSTNVDQFVERRLMYETYRLDHDWCLRTHGLHSLEAIRQAVQNTNTARTTTLIKLYGEFQSPSVWITRREVREHAGSQELTNILSILLNERQLDLVVVGLTPLDDSLITPNFPGVSGSVTFICRSITPFPLFQAHTWQHNPQYIIDPELTLDAVFQNIAHFLSIKSSYMKATGREPDEKELERAEEKAFSNPVTEVVGDMLKEEREKAEKEARGIAEKVYAADQAYQVEEKVPLVELLDISEEEERKEQELLQLIGNILFTLRMDASRQVSYQSQGGGLDRAPGNGRTANIEVVRVRQAMQDLEYDIVAAHRMADPGGFERWRRRVRRLGEDLERDLIQAYPELADHLDIASRAVGNDASNLTLIFEGPRDHLGIPYELLSADGTYLALKHPLCRVISDMRGRQAETFEQFLRDLRKKKRPLRVLLIASGLAGQNLAVDQEVDELRATIAGQVQRLGVRLEEPKVIHTGSASYQEVKKQLEKHSYHIVHYASHSRIDEAAAEHKGLLLWKQTFRGKERVVVPAREVATWLEGCETRLFYLSSCTGAWTDTQGLSAPGDDPGLMEAIAQKGIPYILGFRWYTAENARREFAHAFYDELFKRPNSPERAVWKARNTLYATSGQRDEIWAAPLLIAQNPYFSQ